MKSILFLLFVMSISLNLSAQKKAADWNDATANSVKARIGAISQAEADIRYPKVTDAVDPSLTYDKIINVNFKISSASDEIDAGLKSIGASFIAKSFACNFGAGTQSMVDGQIYQVPVYIPRDTTITSISYVMQTAGDYVADAENSISIYKIVGSEYVEVATSANNGNLWKSTADVRQTVTLTTPYVATAGMYFVRAIYNTSSQIVQPKLHAGGNLNTSFTSGVMFALPSDIKLYSYRTAQTELAATTTITGGVSNTYSVIFILK